MDRVLVLLFLFYFNLFAETLQSSYKVSFGVFGTLGNATTIFKKYDDSYYIRMEADTVGLAKVLSNNRKEVYESRGKIVDGVLQPTEYKKIRINNKYTKIKKFTFDHSNKKVYLEKNHYEFKTNKTDYSKEIYQFYANNDILTLYFNILELIKIHTTDAMIFHAIGGKKENGRVDVIKLHGEEQVKSADFLGVSESETILKVIINQKIFSSSKGELLLSIGDDNLCSIAVLKDVILFGDIKGTKTQSMN